MVESSMSIAALVIVSGLILGGLALLGMILANKQTRLLGVVLVGLGSLPVILIGGYLLASARAREGYSHYEPISHVEGTLSWAGLLVVFSALALLVGAIAGGTHLARKRNIGWAPIVTALVLLVGGGLVAMRASTPRTMHTERTASVTTTNEAEQAFERLTRPQIDLSTDKDRASIPQGEVEITASPETPHDEFAGAIKKAKADKVTVKVDPDDRKSPPPADPEWVKHPPKQIGGTLRSVLSSGPYATDDECLRDRRQQLSIQALQYVRANVDRDPPGDFTAFDAAYLGVSYSELANRLLRDEHWKKSDATFAEMRTLYSLVEIDSADGHWLIDAWRAKRSEGKIEAAVVGGGGVLSLLAVAFGLLKLDEATKGYYTKRLLLGVPAVIIGLLVLVANFV